jgi:hypothetical protein
LHFTEMKVATMVSLVVSAFAVSADHRPRFNFTFGAN